MNAYRQELILKVFLLILLYFTCLVAYDDYQKDIGIIGIVKQTIFPKTIINHHKTFDPSHTGIKPAGYHQKKVKFIHDAIVSLYYGKQKGVGLVVTKDIKFGEILLVEYPLLQIPDHTINDAQVLQSINKIHKLVMNEMNKDAEFRRIWEDQIAGNIQIYQQYLKYLHKMGASEEAIFPGIYDLVKATTNQFGVISSRKPLHVYGVLSKVNLGLAENHPQNVAAVFGGDTDDFVCTLIATADIPKGSELFTDKLFDWYDTKSLTDDSYQEKRMWFAAGQGFLLTEEWKELTHHLNSDHVLQMAKDAKIQTIYSNGIIGKASDKDMEVMQTCTGLSADECEMKSDIKEFVDSRRIFQVIQGKIKPPKWTGIQFGKIAQKWRNL